MHREGAFGVLAGALATPLVLVLTELVHNALAHAYAPGQHGEIVISANQERRRADVLVRDDGCGLPAGFDLDALDRARPADRAHLGRLRAARHAQPGAAAADGGTLARLVIPLHGRPRLTESAEAAGRAAGPR